MNIVSRGPAFVPGRAAWVVLTILVLLMLASLAWGAGSVTPLEAMRVLTGQSSDPDARFVVGELRWPRTLLGLLVGAGLGSAGAVLQAATRNPLAEPGLLGVSAGASFAVVLAISFGSGAAFSGILVSLTTLILLYDQRSADEIRFWVIGALGGHPAEAPSWSVVGTAVGLLMLLPILRPLSALALGESMATGLGLRPRLTRAWALLCVAILVGTATAAAGPIVFVGLVVPFIARRLVGPDIRRTLSLSLLAGPAFVLFADIISRLLIRPYELPIGVVTAFLGAPCLIAIVRGRRLPNL